MTKTVIAIAAALGIAALSTTASAQSTGIYVGAAAAVQGQSVPDSQWGGTATVGYRLNRYLAVEGMAEFSAESSTARAGQALFGNVVAGYPVGAFTPYALVGAGYGFNGMGDANSDPQELWTAGVGVSYNITDRWQLDARYRRIESFNGDLTADRVTVGVNFRF